MKQKRWHVMNFRIPKLATFISFLVFLLFGSLCVTYQLVKKIELSLDNGIIQIFLSRFMQVRHNFTHLEMARLEIFKSFCFPAMVHQTSQHFLWIIKTDPLLNSTIQKQMIELLTPYPNYILIGSNKNEDGFCRLTRKATFSMQPSNYREI
mmetsp:Transcript_12938/g.15799  ORF Transcript_12938/g.15799 Transcript_12938/m.15799 type:complete len:151 (-) Transcript_12938:453-905(-)